MAQRSALVTGASSGIGAEFARQLAAEGMDVVLVARRADRLEQQRAEIEKQHKVRATAIAKDLSQSDAPAAVFAETESKGIAVDWLVNNAGFGTVGGFAGLPVARELEEIRLNVEVLVELTGRCLPAMVARGGGAVMNIASLGAFGPGPYMATYVATKAFVLSFSESIAVELKGTGVHVLCVCPGFTRTEFQQKAEVDVGLVPGMAWMSADDVADGAVRAVGRRTVLVNGTMNSLAATTTRFLPRGMVARMVAGMLRPKEA